MKSSSIQKAKEPLPLRVVFEGQSSRLTTLLHTTIAILLVVRITDLKTFFLIPADTEGWTKKLVFYLACMLTAMYGGALAVGALSLNLRPLTKTNWRARACRSVVALALLDSMVLDTLAFAINLLCGETKDVVSVPATVFVTVIAIAFTIWFNVLYVQMFGCCFCCCCGNNATSRITKNADWFNKERHSLPVGAVITTSVNLTREDPAPDARASADLEAPVCVECLPLEAAPFDPVSGGTSPPESEVSEQMTVEEPSSTAPAEDLTHERALGGTDAPGSAAASQSETSAAQGYCSRCAELEAMLRSKTGTNKTARAKQNKLESVSEEETGSSSYLQTDQIRINGHAESTTPKVHTPLNDAHRWDTMKLVEMGTQRVQHGRLPHMNRFLNDACEIHVEALKKAEGAPKPTRRTSNTLSVAEIVRKFVNQDEDEEGTPETPWWSIRELWKLIREEPGHFRYSVWVKSAFLTSLIILIYTYIRTLSMFSHLSDLYEENRDRLNSNTGDLDVFLRGAGWKNGIDDVEETTVVKLYFIVDAIALDLKYVCWVGYFFGLLVGLYSLVAVLAQHKRISLAVSDGLNTFRQEAAPRNEGNESPWTSFQKKYPILGAVRFLAILSSTAVVQLHIVGFTISILIGIVANVTELSVLMDIFGFYLLAYAVLFVADILLMQFLGSSLIAPDGTQIVYPRLFNFTMVVLSMVHLVIGLLYAVWRLLFMMTSTILSLNRLDVSHFHAGKQLDGGHNAFMAMLVLTVLIQEDHHSFAIRQRNASGRNGSEEPVAQSNG